MQGQIDVVRADGLIEGWCWNEACPGEKVGIAVLADGAEIGMSLASIYRDDLRQANIGDGFHAFSFVSQVPLPMRKRSQTFTLVDAATRKQIGDPFVTYNQEVASLEDRLAELESRNQLLNTKLDELSKHSERTSASSLFAVVGTFFSRLAADATRLHDASDVYLPKSELSQLNNPERVSFKSPSASKMTVLIDASVPLIQLIACLKSLRRAGAEDFASIVILDTGRVDDISLVPAMVRGTRYIRKFSSLVSEWNEAEAQDDADIFVTLCGSAIVEEQWLFEIRDAFNRNANAAAVGCHALQSDCSNPGNGGLFLVGSEIRERSSFFSESQIQPESSRCYPAHALSARAAAFRRSAIRTHGKFDEAYGDDVASAVVDLCCKMRQHGWMVVVQPFATLTFPSGYDRAPWAPQIDTDSRSSQLLKARWFRPNVELPALFVSDAYVFGAGHFSLDELTSVMLLRTSGYNVIYTYNKTVDTDYMTELQRYGAVVTIEDKLPPQSQAKPSDIYFSFDAHFSVAQSPGLVLVGITDLQDYLNRASSHTPDRSVPTSQAATTTGIANDALT